MRIKMKIGDFDVFDSGSVVGNLNEPVDFFIDEKVGFLVRLSFIDDTSQNTHTAIAKAFGKNGVEIIFTNYNNGLGTGNITPVRIGQYNGREFYINYRIYSLQNGSKHIHYTWLLGKGIKNG
jgi:hypothetical protein